MKIEKGIYDGVGAGYSVKIVKVISRPNKPVYADMYFTNYKARGKGHFGMEGKHLQLFLKGSRKRK